MGPKVQHTWLRNQKLGAWSERARDGSRQGGGTEAEGGGEKGEARRKPEKRKVSGKFSTFFPQNLPRQTDFAAAEEIRFV